MTEKKSHCDCNLGLGISVVICGALLGWGNYTLAQEVPIPDGTLGAESSVVTNTGVNNGFSIDGGAIRGINLFHSFQSFSIGEGQSVDFTNPAGVENILSRVTGGSRSEILGTLGVSGNANLFFINPKGISFGPNASLNLQGSFIASTASSLKFADGTQFSATNPQSSPLLTVSVPIGLQFGETAESIVVKDSSVGLLVKPEKTLGLVGGDVNLAGGILQAPGGRIELGSVGSNSFVSLNPAVNGWSLGYKDVQNFQNIALTKGNFNPTSIIDTSGESGGDITLQGKQVRIADASQISSLTTGAGDGGNLTVNASEYLSIIGNDTFITTSTISTGDAGDITINTGKLLISGKGGIVAATLSFKFSSGAVIIATGNGGDLIVNASESVELTNGGFLSSNTQGAGNAGNIEVYTPKLLINNGAITADAASFEDSSDLISIATGNGGDLIVNVSESIELTNDGFLSSNTQGAGNAGNIEIYTPNLFVQDGARIAVDSQSTGDAGNLQIQASSINLESDGRISSTSESGKGGGNINLQDINVLFLRGNSEISTSADGDGKGGNITIDTDNLVAVENSAITAKAVTGEGGNIQITTQGLFVSPDSEITAISELGIDGTVEINRPDVDPSQGLVNLPGELVDVSGLIAKGCGARGSNIASNASKFIITGRGGLPPTPDEVLRSNSVLADLGTPSQSSETSSLPTRENSNQPKLLANTLVEAQGWMIGSKGEVILTAQATTISPSIPWLPPAACNGS